MAIKGGDVYVNRAYGSATESVAGTLTFNQIHFGTSIREKMALVIHRIRYFISPSDMNLLLDDGDSIAFGITRSDGISTIDPSQPSVFDYRKVQIMDFGTPANAYHYMNDVAVADFSTLPGGGKIMPSDPVYVAVQGASLASTVAVTVTIDFTWKQLKPAEYWELVETMRVIE